MYYVYTIIRLKTKLMKVNLVGTLDAGNLIFKRIMGKDSFIT